MATAQMAPAEVKQQQQQQQQAQPPSVPSTAALDNLQAMINGVLIHSGHLLKDQANGGHSARTRLNLRRTVPAAISRFQQSLDDLTLETSQAQMVLRRDLALLRAEREKRERADAERARLAAAKTTVSEQAPAKAQETPAAVKGENGNAKFETPQPDIKPSIMKAEPKAPPPLSTTTTVSTDPLFDSASATGTAQDTEFDFDAMFGDALGDTGAGTDNANNNDVSGADLTFNLNDDSGGSLLRGLEDFAKSGDDAATATAAGTTDQAVNTNDNVDLGFSMPDLPDLSSSNQPSNPPAQPAGVKPEVSTPANQQEQPQTTNDGDVVMETDNLDDLFNLDYEPNPETTEFDDAFFGFGEN